MNSTILVTGGSGLVGNKIRQLLDQNNVETYNYTRRPKSDKDFKWNPSKGEIDISPLSNCDAIIHLAGASVAEGRWTEQRKKEILESRVSSTRLLREKVAELDQRPKVFVSASAIGIYPDVGDQWVDENSESKNNNFLGRVVDQWEHEVLQFEKLGIRTVAIRIGVVLSKEGGALPKMVKPMQYGLGAALGSGKQYMSWIHIDDLANIFIHSLQNESMKGIYNGVAPNPVTNYEFTKILAKKMHRPAILPTVPSFALKLMMGEMANIVLEGNRVSSKKIIDSGFSFQFPTLPDALKNLI